MAINLFIVGNGFDLAHGLKTSYDDFIDFLIEDMFSEQKISSELSASLDKIDYVMYKGSPTYLEFIKSQALRKFNFIDKLTSQELSELKHSIRHDIESKIKSTYRLELDNLFLKSLLENDHPENWVDIEEYYFNKLRHRECGLKKLNEDFAEVRSLLIEYLSELPSVQKLTQIKTTIDEWQDHKLPESHKNLVLNFNYTNTVEQYFSQDDTEIIHIHGQLNNQQNLPVFGYSTTDIQLEELKKNPSNRVMDFIKDILYFVNDNNDNVLHEALLKLEGGLRLQFETPKDFDIHVKILGHSMGMSDTNLLRKILTHNHVKTIESLYFDKDCRGSHASYIDQVKNIERIAPEARHKIIKFNASKRMPQFDDNAK